MRTGRLGLAVVLLAAAAPATLRAQSAAADPSRERTGPMAAPPARPAYAQPAPDLIPRAVPAATTLSAAGGGLSEIRITGDAPKGAARPPAGWKAPVEAGANLRLDHKPGESLDAAWVRRQFELNGLAGSSMGVSRALALEQLINRAFLSAGFVNSGLVVRPAAPGVLELQLVYGRLVQPVEGVPPVSVAWAGGGAKGLTADYVLRRLPSAGDQPLSGLDLERDFRLLAEDPAIRTVNANLAPGARPGEASLALSVYPQDRVDFYISGANDRSPSVGGNHLAIGGSVRNVLAAGDLASAETGWTRGLNDFALGYARPFFSPRATLSMRYAVNDAAVVAEPLTLLDIKARERSGEVGLTTKLLEAPLLPLAEGGGWSPAKTLSVGVLLTRRVSHTYLNDQPFSFSAGSVNGRSEYTAARLVGDFLVRGVSQVFAVSVTGTHGLDGSRSDIPGLAAPKPHFNAVMAQVNYARRLSDKGLEFRARLSGQAADSVLYSGERFSAGGSTSVRGYRENLLLADEGVVGSVELAQPISLSKGQGRGGVDWGAFSLSAFVDGAELHNYHPPQPGGAIYSVGGSVAWVPSDALSAQVTYGKSLKDVPFSGHKDIQDRGLQFRLTIRPLRLRG